MDTSADIYFDRHYCLTPPSAHADVHFLIAKYESIIAYEEREIKEGHESFDHFRIISLCEEFIKDNERIFTSS